MQFFICVFALITLVASDSTPQELETTTTQPFDLASAINSFTSIIADPTSFVDSFESDMMKYFSDDLADMTSSAASASSSLSLQLSTADASGSTSIQSHISQIADYASRASTALQAAQSAANSLSTATRTSTGGAGCVQTAAVGMGALVGGIAVLAHL